jgi:hypothetical protein
MKTNEIKKGTKIRTNQLGPLVDGTMEDNKKGNIRTIKTNGSQIGLFDEIGSVYSFNIIYAMQKGRWIRVEHTQKQKHLRKQIDGSAGLFA